MTYEERKVAYTAKAESLTAVPKDLKYLSKFNTLKMAVMEKVEKDIKSGKINSEDIISLYNELVEEGTPLVSYSEYGTEGKFYNEDDDEIPTDVILDELNYAIGLDSDELEGLDMIPENCNCDY